MSVLKRNRKESQFEVFHHLYRLRREMTDLLLRDFGYSNDKFEKGLERRFGGKSYEDLTDNEKEHHDKLKRRQESFEGLYYTDAESPGVMYRCTRDSGIPLHNMPHELVGHYFEIVKES